TRDRVFYTGTLPRPEDVADRAKLEAFRCPRCGADVHPLNWTEHQRQQHGDDPTLTIEEAYPNRPIVVIDPEFQDLIPTLSADEYQALEASILEEGCRDALVLWEGTHILVDGHNRFRICREHGVGFSILYRSFESRDDVIVWMIHNQLARRNISTFVRSELALRMEHAIAAKAKENLVTSTGGANPQPLQNLAKAEPVHTRQTIADAAEVSHETLRKVKYVSEHAPDPIKQKARAGGLSTHRAYELTKAMEDAPAAVVETVLKDAIDDPKKVQQLKTQHVEAARRKAAAATPHPTGRYHCIVIDPPWPMRKIERKVRPKQGPTLDYPTMTLDEIAALPVPELADEDGCHLYLWVTQKYLPEGLKLMEAWGFKYQCVFTWEKPTGITPYSWMYNSELVLFGRRGNLNLLRNGLKLTFSASTQGHSAKPDVFYDERVIPASPGPRLEMFARKAHAGFVSWGYEANS
ncbi:MAG: hypothetical protein K8L99_04840, partial [Anaerolineae bacterium]|nr:hypothetical protein [Anaerolineae bacterium]